MINSVSYNNQIYQNLYNDRSNIQFCGVQKGLDGLNSAIIKYSKKDTLSLFDRLRFQFVIIRNIMKLIKGENFVAEGHDAAVYKISDEFVSRHKKYSKNDKLKISLVKKIKNPFEDIKSYFGSPIFETGFMKILKNANTGDKFVPCGTPLHRDLTPPTISEIKKYEKEYLPLCASLPQESYDILVKDFKKLGERGYIPDLVNPGNIIISGDKFKIVDELDKLNNPKVTLFDVLRMLLIKYSQGFYAEPKPQLFEARKEILRKSLIAGEKANMQIGDGLFINEDEEYVLEDLLYNHHTGACKIFDKLFYANKSETVPLEERIDMINKHFENIHLN